MVKSNVVITKVGCEFRMVLLVHCSSTHCILAVCVCTMNVKVRRSILHCHLTVSYLMNTEQVRGNRFVEDFNVINDN